VGGTPVSAAFTGMIRSRDVRAFEKDKVEMYKSFRPGDVVRAEVLSLGDSRNYLLTTAKNELGVVYAQSIAGAAMVPISWCEMQCPATSTTEHRKVAKPDMGIADDTIQMQ
jgi:exosome complex component CSL4